MKFQFLFIAAVEPAWEMKTGSATVDQAGGQLTTGGMSLTIEPGVFGDTGGS